MSDKPEFPSTVQEAVDFVISKMSDEARKQLRAMDVEDLELLHLLFSDFGMWVRGVLGLWKHNDALLSDAAVHQDPKYDWSFGSTWLDPDDASMVIIRHVWQRLQDDV